MQAHIQAVQTLQTSMAVEERKRIESEELELYMESTNISDLHKRLARRIWQTSSFEYAINVIDAWTGRSANSRTVNQPGETQPKTDKALPCCPTCGRPTVAIALPEDQPDIVDETKVPWWAE